MTSAPETIVARRQFVIRASPQKVGSLLAGAIYQSLPLERMNVVDDKTFRADLKWRLLSIPVRLYLEGRFTDVSLPDSIACRLSVRRGILNLGMTVMFTMKATDGDSTEVSCSAMAQKGESGGIPGRALRGRQRAFAEDTFDSVRARLERLCS